LKEKNFEVPAHHPILPNPLAIYNGTEVRIGAKPFRPGLFERKVIIIIVGFKRKILIAIQK
jgi:hypothetical protein